MASYFWRTCSLIPPNGISTEILWLVDGCTSLLSCSHKLFLANNLEYVCGVPRSCTLLVVNGSCRLSLRSFQFIYWNLPMPGHPRLDIVCTAGVGRFFRISKWLSLVAMTPRSISNGIGTSGSLNCIIIRVYWVSCYMNIKQLDMLANHWHFQINRLVKCREQLEPVVSFSMSFIPPE